MKRIPKQVVEEPKKPAAPEPKQIVQYVDGGALMKEALEGSAEVHATITAEAMGHLSGKLVAMQQVLVDGLKDALVKLDTRPTVQKPSELQFDIQRDGANRIRGFKVTIIR